MLLTRSPLGLPQCCHWLDLVRLACVKHAASVRPEPGSNSPSKTRAHRKRGRRSIETPRRAESLEHEALAPSTGASTTRILTVRFTSTTTPEPKPPRRSPALASLVLSSVFKERLPLAARASEGALVPVACVAGPAAVRGGGHSGAEAVNLSRFPGILPGVEGEPRHGRAPASHVSGAAIVTSRGRRPVRRGAVTDEPGPAGRSSACPCAARSGREHDPAPDRPARGPPARR